jgi:hypothetical protein
VTCAHLAEQVFPTARLWVLVRMSHSTVGMAAAIEGVVEATRRAIGEGGIVVDELLVAPMVAETVLPQLLYTSSCSAPASTPLSVLLAQAAGLVLSTNTAACEHALLAELGGGWSGREDRGAADDSVDKASATASTLFVLYIDAGPRNQPLEACTLGGESVPRYFSDESFGQLQWLSGRGLSLPPEQVFHLILATAEGDLTWSEYSSRCLAQPDFPSSLVDFLSPSPVTTFTPFVTAMNDVNPGRAAQIDLCKALSGNGPKALKKALQGMLP